MKRIRIWKNQSGAWIVAVRRGESAYANVTACRTWDLACTQARWLAQFIESGYRIHASDWDRRMQEIRPA